jgi:hypothetical protein
MICPRCGVVNSAERGSCTRCSGSLARPPARDDGPLPPVLPVTRRAELKSGRATAPVRASAPVPASAADTTSRPAPPAQGAPLEPASDLYLLSTERSTGQPAPPDGPLSQSDRLPADRPARLAVGLSRA